MPEFVSEELIAAAVATVVLAVSFVVGHRRKVASGEVSLLRSVVGSVLGALALGGLFFGFISIKSGVAAGTLDPNWEIAVKAVRMIGFVLFLAALVHFVYRRVRRS